MMKPLFFALLAACSLSACAGLAASSARNASVAKLGCPSDQIEVSHVDYSVGATSWQAACHGRVIVCTALKGDPNAPTQVECRPVDGADDGTSDVIRH